MNNKLYISLLFIILPVYLWGEVITGRVVDAHNDPVMFANVILLNDSVFISGTTSDEFGGFSIENASEANAIKVSCIGYKDYFCPVRNRGDMEPELRRKEGCNGKLSFGHAILQVYYSFNL